MTQDNADTFTETSLGAPNETQIVSTDETEQIAQLTETLEPLLGAEQAAFFSQWIARSLGWVQSTLLNWNVLVQVSLLAGALVPAVIFGPRLKAVINGQIAKRMPHGLLRRVATGLAKVATPIALYLTLSLYIAVMSGVGQEIWLLETGRSLLTAWILVRLVTLVIQSAFWSKVAFYTIWPIMVLDVFGVLELVTGQLDAMSLTITPGDEARGIPGATISILDVIRAAIIFGLFFWVANTVGNFLITRLNRVDELNSSLKALFAKVIDLLLPVIALLLSLQVVGFNLASLAIFGGAVGLGIGLGLQRIISNFAAGVTLLADKSIKPGDVIEVGDTFGWVEAMNSRYVAVRTRDGTEHLVPNDTFMNEGVVNWSHKDRIVRIHAQIGVSYAADVREVQKLCEDMAIRQKRVIQVPAPRCNLVAFGDSAVNFDLRFWISDPQNGVSNVRSDVMMAVWEELKARNIEIPYPQRDLHLKTGSFNLPVQTLD